MGGADTPPTHAARLFDEAVARAGLTEAQARIMRQAASASLRPADLFSSTEIEEIQEQLDRVEQRIASSVELGAGRSTADLKARAHWQQQLALYVRREELLAERQRLYAECWCFGFGGRDEIGLVAFDPGHTFTGWDGAVRRLPLTAPEALTEAGISEQTYATICSYCPEGRAVKAAQEKGQQIILRAYRRRSLARRWQRTGLPDAIRQYRFAAYPDQYKIVAIEAWYRGETLPGQQAYRAGLVLAGEGQRGKSTIGYLLGTRAFDAGQGILCRTLPDLFDELTATFDADAEQNRDPDQPKAATHQELLDDLKTVWLLMLDDLGTERQSRYTEQTLFQILEARKQAGSVLRTIITTNLQTAELATRFGPRNWSRLSGLFGRVVIDWPLMGPAADGMLDLDILVSPAF